MFHVVIETQGVKPKVLLTHEIIRSNGRRLQIENDSENDKCRERASRTLVNPFVRFIAALLFRPVSLFTSSKTGRVQWARNVNRRSWFIQLRIQSGTVFANRFLPLLFIQTTFVRSEPNLFFFGNFPTLLYYSCENEKISYVVGMGKLFKRGEPISSETPHYEQENRFSVIIMLNNYCSAVKKRSFEIREPKNFETKWKTSSATYRVTRIGKRPRHKEVIARWFVKW